MSASKEVVLISDEIFPGTLEDGIDEERRRIAIAAALTGELFMPFLSAVNAGLGTTTSSVVASLKEGAIDEKRIVTPAEYLRSRWNSQASFWSVFESVRTYAATMQTLLQFLQSNEQGSRMNVLSLGSGPGIYETFLAEAAALLWPSCQFKIRCIDYAEKMIEFQQQLLRRLKRQRATTASVSCAVDDMLTLQTVRDGCIDYVICNNALQWVTLNWRPALHSIVRVLRPNGPRLVYLIVHPTPMVLRDQHGNGIMQMNDCMPATLIEALEELGFGILRIRQMVGPPGTGQLGASLARLAIVAQYQPASPIPRWGTVEVTSMEFFLD